MSSKNLKNLNKNDDHANKLWAEIYIIYKWLNAMGNLTSNKSKRTARMLEARVNKLTEQLRCLSTNTSLSSNNEK